MKAELISIIRTYQPTQTVGEAVVFDEAFNKIDEFKTIELPWKENQRRISCIPEGTYTATKHKSPKFGPCLWIQNVPGRSEILIHPANYARQLLGCIAPGEKQADIDGDGFTDVSQSREAMKQILAVCGEKVQVQISSK